MRPDVAFSIFVATWAVLMIAGFFLFHVNKNARFKRKYFLWFVVLVGVLFIAFVAGMGAPLEILLFMASVAALIAFLNVSGASVRDTCGRTIIHKIFFSKLEYCARCGAKLDN